MNASPETRIRELLGKHVADSPSAHEWSDVRRRTPLIEPDEGPRHSRKLLLVLSAAAAVALIIAGVVALATDDRPNRVRTDDPPVVSTVPPETSVRPTTSTPPSTTTTLVEPIDERRPLAELTADDVVIPSSIPDGWTLGEARLAEQPGLPRRFSFELFDVNEEGYVEGYFSIVVVFDVGSELRGAGDERRIEGVSWWPGLGQSDFGALIGNHLVGLDALDVDTTEIDDFLSGLRAGPPSNFPGTVVVDIGDEVSIVDGSVTAEDEVVAVNGDLELRAARNGDLICVRAQLPERLPASSYSSCQERSRFGETGVIELIDDDLARDPNGPRVLVVIGVASAETTSVEVGPTDRSRAIAPTGGPNRLIEGTFFIAEIPLQDGLYVDGFVGNLDEIEVTELG